jgi:hypothetical protein
VTPRSISKYALEENTRKGKEIRPRTGISISRNRETGFLFSDRKCFSIKGMATTGKILEQIERPKEMEEIAGRLSKSIMETSNNSRVKESLCPETEYSNSDAGKNKRINEKSLALPKGNFCDFSIL